MAYLGNDLQVAYQSYKIIDDISSSFNSSLTSFPLQVGGVAPVPFPINPQQCLISVNGVVQEPDPTGTSGFNLVGNNIVFASAPTTGHSFFGVILAGADYINVGVNYPSGSASAPSITFDTDLDTGIYNPAPNELAITTNSTKRFNINSSGQVEISSAGSNAAPALFFNTDTNTGLYSPGADQLAISTNGTGRLFIDNNGRVGIGVTPTSVLHVKGPQPSITLENSSGLFSGLGFKTTGNATSDFVIIANSSGSEFFSNQYAFNNVTGTEHMRLDSSGRLGLGTSSPENKLHIVGTSATTNTGATILVDDSASLAADIGGSIAFRGTDGSNSRTYGLIRGGKFAAGAGAFDGYLAFETRTNGEANTTERLRITNTGNVGIGTTSPQSELTVRGSNPQITLEPTNDTTQSCRIEFALTDGTVQSRITGGGSQGSEIRFSQGPTERVRIDSSGTFRVKGAGTAGVDDAVQLNGSAPANSLLLDASGRVLVGTSSARANFLNSTLSAQLQIEGTGFSNTSISSVRSSNDQFASAFIFGKNRGSVGANTIVQNNDELGQVLFSGNDGSEFVNGASITAFVDGTPGANDLPSRLVFSTTASGGSSPTERMRISANGRFNCQGIYSFTTASAANVFVASDGNVVRSTSSSKYKTQVEAADYHYSEALLGCEPVWYRSTCAGDNPEWGWWGFIAEDVAKIDPRLVHWKTVQVTHDENGAAVQSPCDPEPEGVAYDRFVPHLLNLIKRQKEQIETMEARLSALEAS